MFLVTGFALSIPVTIVCWLVGFLFGLGRQIHPHEADNSTSPLRLLFAVVMPFLIVCHSYNRKRSLSLSGAWTAFVVGFTLTLSNLCFFASLLIFFFVGSKATRLKADKKKLLDPNYKEGGQRNWVQVICNGGVPTQLALFYLMQVGTREVAINFSQWYTASWLSISVLGAISCSCGDTLASEVGSVYAHANPRLATTLRTVPTGTNGGVTIVGLICSIVGGLLVGTAHYVALLLTVSDDILVQAPAQWLIVLIGGAAGLFGSVFDSLLGATLQYSGFDRKRNCVVEKPGQNVDHISGFPLLDNHSVNLISAITTALVTPQLALRMWEFTQIYPSFI